MTLARRPAPPWSWLDAATWGAVAFAVTYGLGTAVRLALTHSTGVTP